MFGIHVSRKYVNSITGLISEHIKVANEELLSKYGIKMDIAQIFTSNPQGGKIVIGSKKRPNEVEKLKEFITDSEKTYKSHFLRVHLNALNFGFKRGDFIQDNHARELFPKLKKYGFSLPKERTTCMSRSKGDLVLYKNNKKVTIEITNLGEQTSKRHKHVKNHMYRDLLIGKIIRIITLNDGKVIFVLNEKNKNSIINEDFKEIIKKYKINIIFTDFKENWDFSVAKKINDSFKFK